jgi:hypothetical protein
MDRERRATAPTRPGPRRPKGYPGRPPKRAPDRPDSALMPRGEGRQGRLSHSRPAPRSRPPGPVLEDTARGPQRADHSARGTARESQREGHSAGVTALGSPRPSPSSSDGPMSLAMARPYREGHPSSGSHARRVAGPPVTAREATAGSHSRKPQQEATAGGHRRGAPQGARQGAVPTTGANGGPGGERKASARDERSTARGRRRSPAIPPPLVPAINGHSVLPHHADHDAPNLHLVNDDRAHG